MRTPEKRGCTRESEMQGDERADGHDSGYTADTPGAAREKIQTNAVLAECHTVHPWLSGVSQRPNVFRRFYRQSGPIG